MQTPPQTTPTYVEREKIRIDASELKIGMHVCELDRAWDETPFLFQGFTIQTVEDIAAVQQHCDFLYIDAKKSRSLKINKSPSRKAFLPEITKITEVLRSTGKGTNKTKTKTKAQRTAENQQAAVSTFKQTSKLVKTMMDEIRLGKSIDTPMAKEAVSACVNSVIREPETMLLLTRLRNKDEYTSQHSVNVSVISIAFGRHLKMERERLTELGMGGLLHDMGKLMTPKEVLNKPAALDDEEMRIIRLHPEDGRNILMSSGIFYDSSVDVAYNHHERLNGEGYPRGLTDSQICDTTKLVSISDAFDAMTGDRIYANGITTFHALRELHQNRGSYYDNALTYQFVECIGIYPLGTVVEMRNGEIGVVIRLNPKHKLRPVVKILLDKNKQEVKPFEVDVAKPDLDRDNQPYTIFTAHHASKYGIELMRHLHIRSEYLS
jgi:HD-GYP domain-containing protein (c-di-GMP phosphodiesterase class II)